MHVVLSVLVVLHGVLEGGVVGQPHSHSEGEARRRYGVEHLKGLQGGQRVIVETVDRDVCGCDLERVVQLIDLSQQEVPAR